MKICGLCGKKITWWQSECPISINPTHFNCYQKYLDTQALEDPYHALELMFQIRGFELRVGYKTGYEIELSVEDVKLQAKQCFRKYIEQHDREYFEHMKAGGKHSSFLPSTSLAMLRTML